MDYVANTPAVRWALDTNSRLKGIVRIWLFFISQLCLPMIGFSLKFHMEANEAEVPALYYLRFKPIEKEYLPLFQSLSKDFIGSLKLL